MFFLQKCCYLLFDNGPEKGRRVKIEVPTGSVLEFELGDTEADIQLGREEREARDREEAQQPQQREEESRKEGARAEEILSQEEGDIAKRPRTERSDRETEVGGEVGHHSHNTRKAT